MDRKTLIIIVILILAIIIASLFLVNKKTEKEEQNVIQPQEEISDEQMRQTIVTLYYQNKETKELMPEGRMIDAKLLLTDPYTTLISLLSETPKSDKLQSVIPEGTKVLNIELKEDIIYLDLSKEFIDNHNGGLQNEKATIYSIVNTLTELNEINNIKFLINGEENKAFNDNEINFRDVFSRIDKI